jgi:hypothetical protein
MTTIEAFIPAFIPASSKQAAATSASTATEHAIPLTTMTTPPKAKGGTNKATGDFASTFNVPNGESDAVQESSDSRQGAEHEPVVDSSELTTISSDSNATPSGPSDTPELKEASPSTVAFTTPSILRKTATKKKEKKTPVNKKLVFEETDNDKPKASFDIMTLFETEAIEEKLDHNVKVAKRLLKKSKMRGKKIEAAAKAAKQSDEDLLEGIETEDHAAEPTVATTIGRLRKNKVVDLVSTDDEMTFA